MVRKIELSRRRILGTTATVGASAAAAGAGTFAYFSDSERSEDNTVSAGTLDLSVEQNSSEGFDYTWGGADPIAPGDQLVLDTVTLVNTGSIDATKIVLETNITDRDPSNGANFENAILVESGGQQVPLSYLVSNNQEIGNGIDAGATETFDATLTFDSTAGDQYEGASITVEHVFHLLQE